MTAVKAANSSKKCRQEIKARLGKKTNGEFLMHAIDVFHKYTDQLISQRQKTESLAPFDCGKGCTACCHLRVEALPPEIFKIAWHIGTLAEGTQQTWIQRLRQHAGQAEGKTYRDYHARCPFLDAAGGCGIYAIRPHKCRTHLSTSRTACDTPGNARPDPKLQAAEDALALEVIALYKSRGVSMNPAELSQGVLTALTSDNGLQAWLNGEQVFAPLPEGIQL